MSMTAFERRILSELKIVTGNNKLREKDMLDWRIGNFAPQAGEKIVKLPRAGVVVVIPDPAGTNKR